MRKKETQAEYLRRLADMCEQSGFALGLTEYTVNESANDDLPTLRLEFIYSHEYADEVLPGSLRP